MTLRPILEAIGGGAHCVSEIAGRLGQPATSLARPLARLQELDLVTRETPFGEAERSSKRSLYKLSDPLMRFWFRVVAPRRSLLIQATREARLGLFDEALPWLAGSAWEDLCRQAVPRLTSRLGRTAFGPASRYWHGAGPEWDVVAESQGRETLLVGEAKWWSGETSEADVGRAVERLLGRGVPPVERRGAARARVQYALFVPRLPRPRPRHLPGDVHLIDAADVLTAD